MKSFRFLLLSLAVILGSGSVFAQEQDGSRFDEELNEKDWEALYDFINSKRTINVEEKDENLTISGDVRTEWRHLNEWRRGTRLRGRPATDPKSGLPISRNDFDIEFNFRIDYVCQRAWAVAHVQYDNSAGIDDDRDCAIDPKGWHGSGNCGNICLKKAYMGFNVLCDGNRFDVELGRRNLYNTFDSEVQFLSRFDGLLLKYSGKENCGAWYINSAGFLVDERVNQFAWAAETGIYNLYDSGFDFKYSFIFWPFYGKNRCGARNPFAFRFLNSQWTAYYHFDKDLCWGIPVFAYGAIIVNHDAPKRWTCGCVLPDEDPKAKAAKEGCPCAKAVKEKEKVKGKDKATLPCKPKHFIKGHHNIAWYVGLTIGEVVKEGDWAIDIEYQWVEALSIPDKDVSGIGRGNVLNEGVKATCRGNTNYKGFRLEGLYALTDNLTLDCIIDHTVAIDKKIGGRHRYSKLELEAIYAF